jgi:transcriptional regulator with XRE-family HTH domain
VTKDYLVAGNLAVSTDATLVGDGTTATPLGINLANANTFTATQTLPATNAQGDALMTSVNAGTGTVDAARIGNGLTDAQVLNNLTISAGTVNSTPIGATTPSTGVFTTIGGTSLALTAKATSASTAVGDGGTTLVTKDYLASGNLAVTTDATLTGNGTTLTPLGINTANANTYTATQTFPTSNAQGDALIASTNSGTTTINASRIGTGLTDAQVNNNLTIAAGTINSTPIGATTPSTGAFTTINGTSLTLTAKATSAATTAGDGATTLVTKGYVETAGNVAVMTDATMSGDGTSALPLGINVANANSWSATQTFPTSNAQGDALIASTNSGTTSILATRIGNGLTDAQVLNNLTISGGTVNNSPIGATTPSTGVFEYASTADENAAVRGTATQATTNQSIGVWGDASSAGATNTGTIAVLATGNGNATAGQTNVAIQINDGEFAIGRGSTAPSVGTVVEAAAGGTAYSAAGPSGVIELTLGGGNLTTAAPTAGTFQDLGTLTINNRYVTTESIIHVTVVSKVDEGTAPNPESAVYMLDVDNRAAGSFVLRIGMIPTATNGSNYQNTDAIRVGYTVVNPSK